MPIESATYISDLNASNPLGTDQRSTVDDHLRLVKSTVKATWPNVSAAVTPTHTELNYVDGVTSAIQTQLDAKAALASPTFTGTPLAPTPTAGDSSTKIATTAFVGTATASLFQLTSFTCVVTGSPARDLTITPATTVLQFRSPTLSSGVPFSATLPSSEIFSLNAGNHLGGAASTTIKIAVLALGISGGPKLAVANAEGGLSFDESKLITTLGYPYDTATSYYSNPAQTNVPFRVLGYVDVLLDSSQWYTNTPTKVQPAGGQSLDMLSALKATSGFQRLPSGIILQWGTATASAATSGTNTTVTFPTAFSTGCVFASTTATFAVGGTSTWYMTSSSTTQAVFSRSNYANVDTGLTFSWFAIGY
jgi:hypothetical protein